MIKQFSSEATISQPLRTIKVIVQHMYVESSQEIPCNP